MGIRNTISHGEERSEPWRRRLTKRAIIVSAVATATLTAAGGVAIASVVSIASRGGGVAGDPAAFVISATWPRLRPG